MMRLSRDRSKTLLALHGWSGVLLGLLLYAVILTGSLAVFADEIGDWSSPLERPPPVAFPAGLGAKLQALAQTMDPQNLEELTLFPRAGGAIQAFFHHHIQAQGRSPPQPYGVRFSLHPETLAVLARQEGFGEELQVQDRDNALADFLVKLHVSLHIPDPWGFLVTGMLGLAMMVAAVSGLLLHRHLLKELFTIRRWREALLARRDAHVVAASWNLPFAFVLAFTGSFFSFASSVGIPAMAMVAFGGDQQRLIETLVGTPPAQDPAAAPPGDLDAMLRDAQTRAKSPPVFVSIAHYGRADSQLTVFTRAADGELGNHNLVYQGSSGVFLCEKPGLGLVNSLGGTLADLMGPLHFGNFAGLLSKAAWFALGLAGAHVTLSGLLLWTTRRADSPAWRYLARAAVWMGYGLPLALAATPLAYFAGRAAGIEILGPPMTLAFLAAALLSAALAGWLEAEPLRRVLLGLNAAVLMLLPLLRWWCGGPGWPAALTAGWTVIPALDLSCMLGAAWCLRAAWRSSRPSTAPSTGTADDEALRT